jgi:integrase
MCAGLLEIAPTSVETASIASRDPHVAAGTTRSFIAGAWQLLRDAAGLAGFRFHDLRHTVVTDLLEAVSPNT